MGLTLKQTRRAESQGSREFVDFDKAVAGASVGGGKSDGVATGSQGEDEGGIGAAGGKGERADVGKDGGTCIYRQLASER